MFTEAELLAGWERVRDNNGCAGVDAVTVERFGTSAHTRLKRLAAGLDSREYRPLPLLEIVIEKAPGKTRRLLVPTVNDRIAQTAAARQLSHSLEDEFLEVSYAYRPGRGVDQAIARVLQLRDRGYQFVLDADVTAYFDNVDHALLLGLLRQENLAPALLALIESWLAVPVWDGFALKKLGRGVPRGSPVSPVLANLFLHELDVTISASDQHIVRYADDFLVLCDSVASAEQAREVTAGWLLARGLELHPEKTAIRTFQEGFRFLGVTFAEVRKCGRRSDGAVEGPHGDRPRGEGGPAHAGEPPEPVSPATTEAGVAGSGVERSSGRAQAAAKEQGRQRGVLVSDGAGIGIEEKRRPLPGGVRRARSAGPAISQARSRAGAGQRPDHHGRVG